MENQDSRKQQEREGRTVRMREKQAPNLQEPGDGSVQDTRRPGTRGADAGAHRFDALHYKKQQLLGQPPMRKKPSRVPLPKQEHNCGAGEESRKSPGKS